MSDGANPAIPSNLPPMARRALIDCAAGRLPANVALMHLLSAGFSAGEVTRVLAEAAASIPPGIDAQRLQALVRLWRATPRADATVRAVLAAVDDLGQEKAATPEQWAVVFDRVARISPEAGVALYSLGRSDLLEAATRSIAACLRRWGLLRADTRVLDLGCGIGRLAEVLAGEVAHVVGTDVSAAMLDIARGRCAHRSNVTFRQTSGRDLSVFASACFELVTAIDIFPYLVAAGEELASRHVNEVARVLAPGGSALLANFSYRGDDDRDVADVEHYASSAGLELVRYAAGDFAHWDGRTFLLVRS